jgi:hypothetical protein
MNRRRAVQILLVLACLLAGNGLFTRLSPITHYVENRVTYEAKWNGPFFTILMGKIAGYLPSEFSYVESTWRNRRGAEEFFMALDDDGGNAWLRIHSDIGKESAVWLPRKPKDVLNSDVVRFIRSLRDTFNDTSRHVMKGIFIFSKKKLLAEAREFELSREELDRFNPARAFNVNTYDTTGAPGISGRVVITKDSILHYKKVAIYLPADEIEAVLELKN